MTNNLFFEKCERLWWHEDITKMGEMDKSILQLEIKTYLRTMAQRPVFTYEKHLQLLKSHFEMLFSK